MLLRSAKPSFFQKLYVTSKGHTTGKVLPTKLSLYVTVPYCSSLRLSTSQCFCRLSRRCLTASIYIYISHIYALPSICPSIDPFNLYALLNASFPIACKTDDLVLFRNGAVLSRSPSSRQHQHQARQKNFQGHPPGIVT